MTFIDRRARRATAVERKPRTDMRTRDLVNQAVASIPTLGLQRAAEFLAAMNVPAEIADAHPGLPEPPPQLA